MFAVACSVCTVQPDTSDFLKLKLSYTLSGTRNSLQLPSNLNILLIEPSTVVVHPLQQIALLLISQDAHIYISVCLCVMFSSFSLFSGWYMTDSSLLQSMQPTVSFEPQHVQIVNLHFTISPQPQCPHITCIPQSIVGPYVAQMYAL